MALKTTWRELVSRRVRQICAVLGRKCVSKKFDIESRGDTYTVTLLRLVYELPKDDKIREFHSVLELKIFAKSYTQKFRRVVKHVCRLAKTSLRSMPTPEIAVIMQHYVSTRYAAYAKYWTWGVKKYKQVVPAVLREVVRQLESGRRTER